MSNAICLLLPIGLLAACAAGPDFKKPGMELPESFSDGGTTWKRQTTDALPKPQEWWKLYHDSTLSSLVDRSLAGNQNLAAAAARLSQAREISKQARSQYFPGIDLGAGAHRSKSVFRGPSGGSIQYTSFTVPVDLSYEIDAWGKVRRQVESAKASEKATEETLNAMRLSVAGEVAQTYWALRAVDADRKSYNRTLEIRRKALELLRKRRDAGTISGLDLSRAEAEVASAEADRIQLDQSRVQLVNALAVLTGSAATGFKLPENATLPTPPAVPGSVPSELLRQRPDIRAALYRVVAANADIGVATAAFYPSFSIGASTGYETASLSKIINPSSLVWSLGANAMVPLTGQKYLMAQRAAAVAAHSAATADYRQTVLDAVREVENALQGSSILGQRQSAQDHALEASNKTFELSMKRFDAGLVSFLDVVDAERSRLDAERGVNAIRAERLALSVSLIKALGGEW